MNRRTQRWVSATAAMVAISLAVTTAMLGLTVAHADTEGDDSQSTARVIKDAQFAWTINDEVGGGAYAFGCNFLVAGKSGDNGKAQAWTPADAQRLYKNVDGNVRIEKPTVTGGWVAPTWDSKCKDSAGATVTTAVGSTSGNRAVFSKGSGWIDEATGTAELAWKGSFTVAFYGGMTYWSASDPVLQVYADKTARLVARTSGYGADMDDPIKWDKLPEAYVELMDFSGVQVSTQGFTASASYLGRTLKSSSLPQPQVARNDTNRAYWGSFPQSFIDYQTLTGQAAYWYSSGGISDPKKPANDLQVISLAVQDDPADANYTDFKLGNIDGSTPPPTKPTPPVPTTPDEADKSSDKKSNGKAATAKFTMKDAVLRWGLNDETSSAAYFGGCNYLVAGKVGDAGSARVWSESDGFYQSSRGKVEILKPNAKGALQRATWANKCQDRAGNAVSTSNQTTTESIVSISGGNGTVNPKKGTATIEWKGSFTVAFYGGMTYWHVTNPVLKVKANGTGTLKATVGGFGADMADASKWVPLKDRTVTLANLKKVDVTGKRGITMTPEYLGVNVKASGGSHSAQATKTAANSSYWGSFPQSFINFHLETGQSAYWYTSGGARDWAKPATPIQVSYDAATVAKKATNKKTSQKSTDNDRPTTSVPRSTPSPVTTTPLPSTAITPVESPVVGADPAAPGNDPGALVPAGMQQGPMPTLMAVESTELAAARAAQISADASSGSRTLTVVWLGIGAVLLAGAAVLLLTGKREPTVPTPTAKS